jgi:hypothetical protein
MSSLGFEVEFSCSGLLNSKSQRRGSNAPAGPAARDLTIQNSQATTTNEPQRNETLGRTFPFRNNEAAGSEESILKMPSK